MDQGFSGFTGLETFYLVCAGIGTIFVVFKLVMQFLGGDTDTDPDLGGIGGDMEIVDHHVDSDLGFRFLSLQGFSAFLMMFGLVGLALSRQSNSGALVSLPGAVVAGLAAVWVIGKLFHGAYRLQSSGTLTNTGLVGCTGTVYLTLPEGGKGRVNINHNNRQREFDAIAGDGGGIPTGTLIRVTAVQGNVVTVAAIN
ncbi:MAG: NfeD family protein [Proteobacteria bacterium]|nr:NfeD family protein [Pseudomonadota bacterium]MBU1687393.1 NfeD family protein [Pseudomonadota bacterium]